MDAFGFVIALAVVGLAGGAFAAVRWIPSLADTREGRLATGLVRLLVASAGCVVLLDLNVMIYNLRQVADGVFGRGQRSEVLTSDLPHLLTFGGLLLAAAAIVHLLAPAADAEESVTLS